MNATVKKLLDEALELPKSDRARLAMLLFESVETDSHENQEESLEAVIERRVMELETGAVQEVSLEEVQRELWAGIRSRAAD